MKELQSLLENELLNDETKKDIKELIEVIKEQANNDAKASLEVEYAEKFIKEKKELSDKLPEFVNESVMEEISSLKTEIEYYKELDVVYAKRFHEFKEKYNEKMTESVNNLVESVVKEEIGELREGVQEAKRIMIGKRVVEAIMQDVAEFGISTDVKTIKDELDETKNALKEATKTINTLERSKKLGELLSPLKGTKREIMSSILEGVETDKLETRFNETINRVVGEENKHKEEDIKEKDGDKIDDTDDEINSALILSGIKTK